MSPLLHYSISSSETRRLGWRLGRIACSGDVICLIGELGAGKTQLAQGVAEGLGIASETVTSPTYSLIAEHTGGRLALYHMDAYRLSGPEELGPIGFDDYIGRRDGVIVIEWADRIAAAIPDQHLRIDILPGADQDDRDIILTSFGERADRLALSATQPE